MAAKMDCRAGNRARSGDIFIALMGVTGSGKSSFIKHLAAGKQPKVGHSLFSCTTEVDVYPYKFSDDSTVYLIDTPGFNDTAKSDTAVLCELISWLTASYAKENIKLHGVIYLHSIMETRMQGSTRTNLGLLKRLVGADNLKNIVLTTTRWDLVEPKIGEKHEKELIRTPEFWGDMIKQGSTTYRCNNTQSAARLLIAQLVQSRNPIILAIINDMVHKNLTLDQTTAGRWLVEIERGPYEKRLKEIQYLLAAAIGQKDKQQQKELEEIERQHQKQLDDLKQEHQRLNADSELLWKVRLAKLERQIEDLRNLSPSPTSTNGRIVRLSSNVGRKSAKPSGPTDSKVPQKELNVKDFSRLSSRLRASSTSPGPAPTDSKVPQKELNVKDISRLSSRLRASSASPNPAPKRSPAFPSLSFTPVPMTGPSAINRVPLAAATKENSKSPSPRPESPLPTGDTRFIRSKPENHVQKSGFRASFCLPFYSLEGPNKSNSNLPCKLRKGYKISLGANGHWVAFEPGKAESEIFTSPGFANEYHGLITRFNRDSIEKSGALHDLTLGPNRNYWAGFEKKSAWNSSNDKFFACMNIPDTLPELVALGAGDAFVIKRKNGKVDYYLPDDKYPKLNRKHLANDQNSGELKMVALDPDGLQFITVTAMFSKFRAETLSDSQCFEIEEWLTLNAGVSWAGNSRRLESGELVPKWVK